MANTYELITSQTLSSSVSTVTFSSIPNTFTDLKLVISARTDKAVPYSEPIQGYFNGSNANLTYRRLYYSSGSVGSDSGTTGFFGIADSAQQTASTFGNSEAYIPNYASSNYKSFSTDSVSESNAANDYQSQLTASLWSSTAAITSITLYGTYSGNFVSGSTFYLYGIKNS